jgi:hypothetical protein
MQNQLAMKHMQKRKSKRAPTSTSLQAMSPNRSTMHPILQLQRAIGNQAVQNVVHGVLRTPYQALDVATSTYIEPRFDHDFSQIPIHSTQTVVPQTKPKANQSGNGYEREAEQVAEQVMRMTNADHTPFDVEDKAKDSLMRNQSKELGTSAATTSPDVLSVVRTVLSSSGGQPLDTNTRAFMEPRFGQDFSRVHVHTDARASESARLVNALAYTFGRDMVFGIGQYQPKTSEGQRLLAHELTHVVQQEGGQVSQQIQKYGYGGDIPEVANPTVTTMRQFIDLVRKIEAANPGLSALQIAEKIRKSKYHTYAWEKLLPSSKTSTPVTATGGVTAEDVATLSGEYTITLPQGGQSDPSHIVAALVANAETKAPGWPISEVIPSGVPRLDFASWAGDVGAAAGKWMVAIPISSGRTKQDYMNEEAPESDLIADVDGVAMTATSTSSGFVFNPSLPLSDNLEHFYFPIATRAGKNRRFHTFCAVEGFALEADGVTLSNNAVQTIGSRIHAFADFLTRNDPDILIWMSQHAGPSLSGSPPVTPFGGGEPGLFGSGGLFDPIPKQWIARANDWTWFAQQFCNFVQRNLKAEGS